MHDGVLVLVALIAAAGSVLSARVAQQVNRAATSSNARLRELERELRAARRAIDDALAQLARSAAGREP